MKENKLNWEDIYSKGESYLEYPNEALVVTYHRIKKYLPQNTTCLDFGFGSGNNTQFLINRNEISNIYGLEISNNAKNMVKERLIYSSKFNENNFVISDKFIPEFENKFDLIVAWHVISYNTNDSVQKAIDNFKKYLKKDGLLITTLATPRDISMKYSNYISTNTYKINNNIPSQEDCIVVIPKDEKDFEKYFGDFETLDLGHEERLSYKKDDFHSHFYGVFKKL